MNLLVLPGDGIGPETRTGDLGGKMATRAFGGALAERLLPAAS